MVLAGNQRYAKLTVAPFVWEGEGEGEGGGGKVGVGRYKVLAS